MSIRKNTKLKRVFKVDIPKDQKLALVREEWKLLYESCETKISLYKSLGNHDNYFLLHEGYLDLANVKKGIASLLVTQKAIDALKQVLAEQTKLNKILKRQGLQQA